MIQYDINIVLNLFFLSQFTYFITSLNLNLSFVRINVFNTVSDFTFN